MIKLISVVSRCTPPKTAPPVYHKCHKPSRLYLGHKRRRGIVLRPKQVDNKINMSRFQYRAFSRFITPSGCIQESKRRVFSSQSDLPWPTSNQTFNRPLKTNSIKCILYCFIEINNSRCTHTHTHTHTHKAAEKQMNQRRKLNFMS